MTTYELRYHGKPMTIRRALWLALVSIPVEVAWRKLRRKLAAMRRAINHQMGWPPG
jgi:hypothetical protein